MYVYIYCLFVLQNKRDKNLLKKKKKKRQFTEERNPNDQQTYKSAPLVIKKLHNKTITRYHFTFIC